VLFPEIDHVEHSEDTLTLSLTIPDTIHYFEGHFPQASILPGVVQVHWALYYLNQYFNMQVNDYKSVDVLKFQIVIKPSSQIKLCIKKLNDNKFSFNYSSENGNHSSGRVVYQ
jgi:3-hydroxymyristoyl/3-hydroxydecanoyl-(acyl carrier protein) dehydratase